ncbi:MAG: hypothetical protein GX092_03020 [Clostridia bacterium]|nr:hypothetical protein [Clostridia bacterium]
MTMQKKERIIWSAVLIVILVVAAIVVLSYHTKLNSLSQKVAELEEYQNAWIQREAELMSEIEDLKIQFNPNDELTEPFPTNNSEILNSLKRQGFTGKLQDIIDDLTEHSELIPFEGVLGGKMGFYNKEDIYVLSDKWVLAKFEDGHIGGNMLLRYSVKNNKISWEVLDAYLYD